jgi:hypothetical protein
MNEFICDEDAAEADVMRRKLRVLINQSDALQSAGEDVP